MNCHNIPTYPIVVDRYKSKEYWGVYFPGLTACLFNRFERYDSIVPMTYPANDNIAIACHVLLTYDSHQCLKGND